MSLYPSTSSSKAAHPPGLTEFEILKASHKFLRENDQSEESLSWNEQLAAKYYANLYREFAVCDLKHYKTGNFALRWRTEDEVLLGAGETTCGNTRCEHHSPPRYQNDPKPSLSTLELPFAYVEHGEGKSALVKVVLCGKCLKKLLYKRRKEKERELEKELEKEGALPVEGDVDPEGEKERPQVDVPLESGTRLRSRSPKPSNPDRGERKDQELDRDKKRRRSAEGEQAELPRSKYRTSRREQDYNIARARRRNSRSRSPMERPRQAKPSSRRRSLSKS
ncbi:hypothetical protein BDN72DRAFT_767233 [Pluteus cervinus]|uniref:Uncharacterized protein n=1 Tax=Pluteus cervinus TaxID=181527 RepID=A0ACD3AWH8_9AGAR|nr:hypothetical protein BDN72DRAFT_767233 [Pluteus cervinus]